MCEPTTLLAISTAVSVAAAGASAYGQQQQAKAQAATNAQQAENVRVATIANYDANAERQQQERTAAVQQITDVQRDGIQARARTAVAAGEAGVAGLSVNALLQDFHGQELNYVERVRENYSNTVGQIARSNEAIFNGGQSTINSMPTPQAPNLLGTALQIGGTLAEGGMTYRRMTTPPK